MSRFTTSALDAYLRLLRRPVDAAVGLIPGPRTGPGAAARLTVDRFDASLRAVLGAALGDPELSEQARRRQAATDERERAVKLRQDANVAQERSDARLEERHEQASERREQAQSRAASRRRQAERSAQTRTRRARQTAGERLQASREQEKRTAERIETQADRERLPAVEEQAQALSEREAALEQADEARRVAQAAARVKGERKEL
jgi:hypothetical protein